MPSSPYLLNSGLLVLSAIVLLTVMASTLTLIASTILLWRYRRTVDRLMSASAAGSDEGAPGRAPFGQDAPHAALPSGAASSPDRNLAEQRFRLSVDEPWRCARRYAVGGLLFAAVLGRAAWQAFSQTQINSLSAAAHHYSFLFLIWTLAWPVVLTTNLVAASGWRKRCLVVLIYFFTLALLGTLLVTTPTEAPVSLGGVSIPDWSGETPVRLIAKWSLFNLAPTLLIGVFRNRRIRAVAPLVLGFMTVVSAGLLGVMAAVSVYWESTIAAVTAVSHFLGVDVLWPFIGCLLLLLAVSCIPSGLLGWGLLVWMRRGYQCKSVSDQSLAIDALWLVFATYYAAILAFAGPGWALAALVALLVFGMTVRIGNRHGLSNVAGGETGPALLVLRVFSLGQRSEKLFELVSKQWRYIGNVQLIVGLDLATSTIAPHQFLAFVSGRLPWLFMNGRAAIERSAGQLDNRRDRDGRFRINDFYCHADTWRGVLVRLVSGSDAVLMDLRNFAPGNDGCVFEINALLNTVPLQRLVFVIDATTDKAFFNRILATACRELSADSPNPGLLPDAVQPFELASLRQGALESLLQRLSLASASGVQSPSAAPA